MMEIISENNSNTVKLNRDYKLTKNRNKDTRKNVENQDKVYLFKTN
jgi:hypothetical protein